MLLLVHDTLRTHDIHWFWQFLTKKWKKFCPNPFSEGILAWAKTSTGNDVSVKSKVYCKLQSWYFPPFLGWFKCQWLEDQESSHVWYFNLYVLHIICSLCMEGAITGDPPHWSLWWSGPQSKTPSDCNRSNVNAKQKSPKAKPFIWIVQKCLW